VGLREVNDRLWLVSYADLDLGEIDERRHCFTPSFSFATETTQDDSAAE
jgi:hypothetical protein